MKTRRFLATLIALCGALAVHGAASAQEIYPNKPVKVIVAIPPGGSVDMVARLITQRLSDDLGQTFFVENKGGASGMIGTGQLVRSPADGYTLSVIPASFIATNKALFKNLPYDPQKDLAPVTKLVDQSMVLVVRQGHGVGTVQDLIKLAKDSPGKLTFASAGDGTPHHLAAVLFQDRAKVSLTHVPYKGGALAMNDLLAGHVDMVFAGLPEALPHIRTNKLKALGLLSQKRSPVANDIPTMAEAGLTGMDLSAWMALVAPANTPQPILDKLNAAVTKILNGEARTKLHEAGLEASPSTQDQLRQLMNSDTRLHGELLKAAGVQPQ